MAICLLAVGLSGCSSRDHATAEAGGDAAVPGDAMASVDAALADARGTDTDAAVPDAGRLDGAPADPADWPGTYACTYSNDTGATEGRPLSLEVREESGGVLVFHGVSGSTPFNACDVRFDLHDDLAVIQPDQRCPAVFDLHWLDGSAQLAGDQLVADLRSLVGGSTTFDSLDCCREGSVCPERPDELAAISGYYRVDRLELHGEAPWVRGEARGVVGSVRFEPGTSTDARLCLALARTRDGLGVGEIDSRCLHGSIRGAHFVSHLTSGSGGSGTAAAFDLTMDGTALSVTRDPTDPRTEAPAPGNLVALRLEPMADPPPDLAITWVLRSRRLPGGELEPAFVCEPTADGSTGLVGLFALGMWPEAEGTVDRDHFASPDCSGTPEPGSAGPQLGIIEHASDDEYVIHYLPWSGMPRRERVRLTTEDHADGSRTLDVEVLACDPAEHCNNPPGTLLHYQDAASTPPP